MKNNKKKSKNTNEDASKDETIVYKVTNKKGKKGQKKKKHPKLRLFIKIMLITFVLLAVIGGGVFGAIMYRCIWGDWALSEEDLNIKYLNSTVYDINGDLIATLDGSENRQIVSKEEMSKYLPAAFISIEDERFEKHHGVDWKRTAGAILTFATHSGESSFGGSTLTQQLIKNLTDEREDSGFEGALRKVKEIVRAYQVENILSKDQVIELYLNLIPLGKVYGVQMASRYYFNKDAKDLTLVESAYLAGITHAPSTYNPFGETDRTERIKTRVVTVLNKMKELGRISQEEYDSAIKEVDNGIKFTEGKISEMNNLTYHTEAALDEIVEDLMEKNGWEKKVAQMHLYGDGYKIYTTYDPAIQKAVNKQYIDNSKKYTTSYKTVTRKNADGTATKVKVRQESAMVIIDHKTGQVVAGYSGFGEKTEGDTAGTNRMTDVIHSPGSSIKPLAVIGPSLQEGKITAGTVVDDSPLTVGNYTPKNSGGGYNGLMNIRYILRVSRNIPEVRMMQKLTVEKSLEYLAKFGLDTSREQNDGLSLALGGMSYGPTVLQMAGAYATIANDGTYIEPTFYTKITDGDGNTVMETKQETRRVLSEQNAWILQTLLKEPTGTGMTGSSGATATRARVKNQATAGKTGTTNDSKALWFCGFTPYYAGAVWLGYDIESDGKAYGGSGLAASLWGNVMNDVHSKLPKADFDKPDGIETAVICKESGLLATDLCKAGHGTGNMAYTEYFVKGTKPTDTCDVHVKAKVCNVSGKLASDNCRDTSEKIFITREDAEKNKSWQRAADAKYMLPTEKCDQCLESTNPEENNPNGEPGNTTNPNTSQDPNTNTNQNTNTNTNPNTNTNQNANTNQTQKPNTNTNTNQTQKPSTNANETQKPNTNTTTTAP